MKISIVKNLAPLKDAAKAEIDHQAGLVRQLYITTTPGQEMVYLEKRREAEAVSIDPVINPAEVPHLATEAALNNVDLLTMAAVILTTANSWSQASALIENQRLAAKQAVDAAANPAEIKAAREQGIETFSLHFQA